MKVISSAITIIGGGLSGLTLAYWLQQKGISVSIVEARARLGGRIFTAYAKSQAPQEMGATWLGKKHSALVQLLKSLGLEVFEQKLGTTAIYEPISTSPPQLVNLPPNNDPSYRIKGGSSILIQTLEAQLKEESIFTQQVVESIHLESDGVSIKSGTHEFKSQLVVSTLPPYLLTQSIAILPRLPEALLAIAEQTHTWMGDSIKISLAYERPFWRAKNSSGTIVSNVGPIPEMYDHSNYEEEAYALMGFLNGNYFSLNKEERLALIMKQLEKYYGSQAQEYLAYQETVWRKEVFTFANYTSHVLPHQYNGDAVYQRSYWEGRLYLGGSETATAFPGYMEGAVRSAEWLVQQIEKDGLVHSVLSIG